ARLFDGKRLHFAWRVNADLAECAAGQPRKAPQDVKYRIEAAGLVEPRQRIVRSRMNDTERSGEPAKRDGFGPGIGKVRVVGEIPCSTEKAMLPRVIA